MSKKILKTAINSLLIIVVVAILAISLLLFYLTINEYKPSFQEDLTVKDNNDNKPALYDTINLLTWNIGYGALGDNADFFMDGGKSVNTADEKRLQENLSGINAKIKEIRPEIILLQEVDTSSYRSHYFDESAYFSDSFNNYDAGFAYNFKVDFIPYPIPPIGKVNSGILTLSAYDIASATRYSLPCPFIWPIRLANLKRCITVNRIPIENTDKFLTIINLHLEAYDNGEGKLAQTAVLKEIIEDEYLAGNYVIAAGDFNQIFSNISSPYEIQEGKWQAGEIDTSLFSNNFNFFMDSTKPSCRSLDQSYIDSDKTNFQYYIIDGFIVSDNIVVEKYETIDEDFRYSDHNPVLLSFYLSE